MRRIGIAFCFHQLDQARCFRKIMHRTAVETMQLAYAGDRVDASRRLCPIGHVLGAEGEVRLTVGFGGLASALITAAGERASSMGS